MLQTQRTDPGLSALSLLVLSPVLLSKESAFTLYLHTCAVSAFGPAWLNSIQNLQGEGGSAKLHALHPAGHFSLQLISPFSDLKHRIHWNSGCFGGFAFLALSFLVPGSIIELRKKKKKDLKRNLRTQHLKICLYFHFLEKEEREEHSIQCSPFMCLFEPHKDLRKETDRNSSKPFSQKHFAYQVYERFSSQESTLDSQLICPKAASLCSTESTLF